MHMDVEYTRKMLEPLPYHGVTTSPPRESTACTPGNSSAVYEVHVLSAHEVADGRPPSAGDATVNVVNDGQPGRPIVLVFASYEPVNWILNLPADLIISKVILVSTH